MIRNGDIAVIKTSDDHPYYLLKLSKDPYKTSEIVVDDYKHQIPPLTKVVEGSYFELHKTSTDGDVYYLDTKRALVSSFCVVGSCPPLEILFVKKRGKEQEMFKIKNDLHQVLCELVNFSDI